MRVGMGWENRGGEGRRGRGVEERGMGRGVEVRMGVRGG